MLNHLDSHQNPTMVDVGAKAHTERKAIASGQISMGAQAYRAVVEQKIAKGRCCKLPSSPPLWGLNKPAL